MAKRKSYGVPSDTAPTADETAKPSAPVDWQAKAEGLQKELEAAKADVKARREAACARDLMALLESHKCSLGLKPGEEEGKFEFVVQWSGKE